MKKKHASVFGIIALAAVIGFTVLACGGGSPSSVVKQLYTAIEKGDAKGISETMTPESASLVISMLEKVQGTFTDKGGIAKTEEEIDGDTAVVTCTYKDGSTEDMNLVKVDGKWKVTIGK